MPTRSVAARIEARIYVIRGERVMLDADLAVLYGVATKRLNEAVRRNPDRFPPDFRFRLSAAEAGHCSLLVARRVEPFAVLQVVQKHEQRHRSALVDDVVPVPHEVWQPAADRDHAIRLGATLVDLDAEARVHCDATDERPDGDAQRLSLLEPAMRGEPVGPSTEISPERVVVTDAPRHSPTGRRRRCPLGSLR